MTDPGAWNGILLINKEAGYTSNDVVAKLRGILRQKKIGHTGTLDPAAIGLLVVCLGSATRVVELLTAHEKEYIAQVQLGVVTDTQDLTGRVVETRDPSGVTHEALMEALRAFRGSYEQLPPMYSAIKVGGERLYKMAREGRTVERAPRRVEIRALSLLDESCLASEHRFAMEVRCSKGTYIRTLCHDIGERLGCGAAMASLLRTAVGSFRVEDALTLDQVESCRDRGTLEEHILSVEGLFRDLDRVDVDPSIRGKLENGNPFEEKLLLGREPEEEGFREGELVRAYCEDIWFGIYRYSRARRNFRVERFFYGR